MLRWCLLVLVACGSTSQPAPPAPQPAVPADAPADAPAIDAAAAALGWQWAGEPDVFPLRDLTAGPNVLSLVKDALVLRGPSWTVNVAPGDDLSGAAMVADAQRVYVATYGRIRAGCALAAFDAATGARTWSVTLEGIGPIAHSKYSNRVELRVVGGHPTVFGSEAKRYIEQRDAATGAPRAHELLPPERQPIPIGEPLYQELDHMLATRGTYSVRVSKFLSRHVLMKDADHAARGAAFATAIRQINGSAIRRGAYTLDVTLVERGDDFEVIAKRRTP